jgi:hypothetical protein
VAAAVIADLRGLTVTSVEVNDAPPATARELIITPAEAPSAASGFVVEIDYNGEPGPAPRDPDGFLDG